MPEHEGVTVNRKLPVEFFLHIRRSKATCCNSAHIKLENWNAAASGLQLIKCSNDGGDRGGIIDHSDYELVKDCLFIPLVCIIKHVQWESKQSAWTFQLINSWIFVQ